MRWLLYDMATTLAAPPGVAYLAASPRYRSLLGRFAPRVPAKGVGGVWFHACSVGEVAVARPLIKAFCRRWPGIPVLLTVSTVTGRAQAERLEPDIPIAWLPFDHRLSVGSFIKRARPRALILVETELWPNLIRSAQRRSVPVLVANGRLSDRHFESYRKHRGWFEPLFRALSALGMQTEEYRTRAVELGADVKSTIVTGSMKFDGVTTAGAHEAAELRSEMGIPADAPVLVFGSTRPGDEAMAAACWPVWQEAASGLRLIIAPRHLERVEQAASALKEPVARRSEDRPSTPTEARIHLLDTLGELGRAYAMATVAIIGGSFSPEINGHNPLEPASLGIPAVFGPHMRNFAEPAAMLIEGGGALQVADAHGLCATVQSLLADEHARKSMSEKALRVVAEGRGAVARTLDLLAPFVEG